MMRKGALKMLTLILALLAPAAAYAEAKEAEREAGDDVKVLGFTFGKPPPKEAVLEEEAGQYRTYVLKHRWCERLSAATDNGRVVSVSCSPNDPDAMLSLLRSRYGPPQEEVPNHVAGMVGGEGESSVWFTPYGTAIINVKFRASFWGTRLYGCARPRWPSSVREEKRDYDGHER